jgi:hypothetical protein
MKNLSLNQDEAILVADALTDRIVEMRKEVKRRSADTKNPMPYERLADNCEKLIAIRDELRDWIRITR